MLTNETVSYIIVILSERKYNMSKSNQSYNTISFIIEILVFGSCAIGFFLMNFFFDVQDKTANIIYITFISLSFGWLFSFETILKKVDYAVHTKMSAKFYRPVPNATVRTSYKRKGIKKVIALWFFYLGFIGFIKYMKILTWQLFLSGMSILFMFNSIFIRKKCLLSVFFLHNKNHCCKHCGINCWDYAIFASALIFAPQMSVAATVLNVTIIFLAFLVMFLWEFNYHKHPYRFYPETNASLSCKYCTKKCNHKKQVRKGETYEI